MTAYISNHQELASNRIIQQYRESSKIQGLIKAIINPIQEIEDQLHKLYHERWIDKAIGKQLDNLGAIVGEERHYRCDDEYRRAIYVRIMINNGGGTPEDIISAVRYLYSPSLINYSDLYPGSFQIYVQGNNDLVGIKPLIRSISPAGIGDTVITYVKGDNPFIFSECSNETVELEAIEENDEETILNVNDEIGEDIMQVTADTLLIPNNTLGFAEITITKFNLVLSSGEIYLIGENTPLEMIDSFEEFTIEGGSKLAEVIENG